VTTTVALQVVLILLTVGLSVGIPPDTQGWPFIVGVVLTIGSVITMYATYSVAVRRTRQIALFRALGARRSLVLKLVAWEMGLLALVGVLVGAGFGLTVQVLVNRYLRAIRMAVPLRWLGYMTVIGLVGPLLGAVSGVSTAMRGTISSVLPDK
jgi:putative ABC transport system permease protein